MFVRYIQPRENLVFQIRSLVAGFNNCCDKWVGILGMQKSGHANATGNITYTWITIELLGECLLRDWKTVQWQRIHAIEAVVPPGTCFNDEVRLEFGIQDGLKRRFVQVQQ